MINVKALKNCTNRPIELVFADSTERIAPMSTGKYHTDSEWTNSLAKGQADVFIKRHEAKFVVKNGRDVAENDLYIKTEKKQQLIQTQQTVNTDVKPSKKGDK